MLTANQLRYNVAPVPVTKDEISRVMSALGKKGGSARTPAKAAASRRNGTLAAKKRKRKKS